MQRQKKKLSIVLKKFIKDSTDKTPSDLAN